MRDVRIAAAILVAAFAFAAPASADDAKPTDTVKPPEGDCTSTPPAAAVMTLPAPLDGWGQVVCSRFGYVIANKPGWIWSEPGGYIPVYIPAQMVATDPKPLGNAAYFTAITVTKSAGPDYDAAYAAYSEGFAPDEKKPAGYRLDVTSVLGTRLTLFFFDYGDHAWGIWCGMTRFRCNPQSRFMLLGKAPRPTGGDGN
jgi:hypothetical protein